jgi:hypothetical protein
MIFNFAKSYGIQNEAVIISIVLVVILATIFVALCFIRYVIIARLVSLGWNRWSAMLILIPYINFIFSLVLLFYPARKIVSSEKVV